MSETYGGNSMAGKIIQTSYGDRKRNKIQYEEVVSIDERRQLPTSYRQSILFGGARVFIGHEGFRSCIHYRLTEQSNTPTYDTEEVRQGLTFNVRNLLLGL